MSTPGRWLIQLSIAAPDLSRASLFARTAARALAYLHVDIGATTVAAADQPEVRHRVFCHRQLDTGRRCILRHDHRGDCTPRIRR